MSPTSTAPSKKRIVVLGGGTGGTMVANRLRRHFDGDEAEIHVVDRDDAHVYQPGLLFVPFGLAQVDEIVRPRRRQLRRGIAFHENEVVEVRIERNEVLLDDRTVLPYDVLVVASGARLQPEETEGLAGPGWNERVFTFYTPDSAVALHAALERFDRGRLIVNLVDMPIKCPVAPLEFAFLPTGTCASAESATGSSSSTRRHSTAPSRSRSPRGQLAGLLGQKEIELVTEFNAGEVDGVGGKLASLRRARARLRPARHRSPARRRRLRRALARPRRLRSASSPPTSTRCRRRANPNVFALGDATDLPTSKAGSVTHFEAEILVENVVRHLAGRQLVAGYDGHANCFIETGFHKALLIDFNYDTEPLPGRFPTAVGPAAAAPRVAPQPPRQAALPVGLLARAAPRPRDSRPRPGDADRREEARPHDLKRRTR